MVYCGNGFPRYDFDEGVIIIKGLGRVKDPLKVLIGKTLSTRHLNIEELESYS